MSGSELSEQIRFVSPTFLDVSSMIPSIFIFCHSWFPPSLYICFWNVMKLWWSQCCCVHIVGDVGLLLLAQFHVLVYTFFWKYSTTTFYLGKWLFDAHNENILSLINNNQSTISILSNKYKVVKIPPGSSFTLQELQ